MRSTATTSTTTTTTATVSATAHATRTAGRRINLADLALERADVGAVAASGVRGCPVHRPRGPRAALIGCRIAEVFALVNGGAASEQNVHRGGPAVGGEGPEHWIHTGDVVCAGQGRSRCVLYQVVIS